MGNQSSKKENQTSGGSKTKQSFGGNELVDAGNRLVWNTIKTTSPSCEKGLTFKDTDIAFNGEQFYVNVNDAQNVDVQLWTAVKQSVTL